MAIDQKGCIEYAVAPWSADAEQGVTGSNDKKDWIAEECPVALVYNGISHAVMMASPYDLEAFAIGFSFTEAIIDAPSDIYEIEVQQHITGFEVALSVTAQCFARLKHKRRNISGRTGCGVCGIESLAQVNSSISHVNGMFSISHNTINRAAKQFNTYQPLQSLTGAVHGAAWCNPQGDIIAVAEDVGRHNALDKLIGSMLDCALTESGSLSSPGFLLISSRASYEIVQKAARAGVAIVVAVSAPTSLAISIADQSQLTLLGFSRAGRHVIYTHGHRIN
jgi:formate dehydrogenase accessory protein FdhD